MESGQMAFEKDCYVLVKGTRWYSTTRANMFDKMTLTTFQLGTFFPVSCKNAKCKVAFVIVQIIFPPWPEFGSVVLYFQGWMGRR